MKKYDAYKDSGVKWIGEIPNHWEAIKISRVHPIIGSGTTPLSSREDYYSLIPQHYYKYNFLST